MQQVPSVLPPQKKVPYGSPTWASRLVLTEWRVDPDLDSDQK